MDIRTYSLILLVLIVIAMSIFIIWRRIITKPLKDKLIKQRDALNAEPKKYVPPSEMSTLNPALNALRIDPGHCPFCRGEIEPNVKKCKHCGEWLDEEHQKKEEQLKEAQLETAKHSKSINQAIGWIVFILFGIPALIYLFKGC